MCCLCPFSDNGIPSKTEVGVTLKRKIGYKNSKTEMFV